MGEYIVDFKSKLEAKIARHADEAARLAKWRDKLEADGFNWGTGPRLKRGRYGALSVRTNPRSLRGNGS